MAFEIKFKYYEKTGLCDYDKAKELEYVKTVGDLQVDLPLEKLASVILGQMARRDILVFDVEIYEFTKKKISFKETKNGIVIKNKKFNLGLDNIVVTEEEAPQVLDHKPNLNSCAVVAQPQEQPIVKLIQPQVNHIHQNNNPPPNPTSMIGNRKPIKKVIFSPSDLKYLRGKSWRFTPNKEYLVYRERYADNGVGMLYLMYDDRNREFEVQDEFFIPAQASLIGDSEESSFNSNNDLLNWSGKQGNSDMPKLR